MEVYHHIGPHRLSAELSYLAATAAIHDNCGESSVAIHVPAKGKSENELADFPRLRDMRNAEGVRDLLVVNGFPNFNLFSTNNLLACYEMNPIAYGKTNLKGHTMLHRGLAGVLAERQAGHRRKFQIDSPRRPNCYRGTLARPTVWSRPPTASQPIGKIHLAVNQLYCDRLGLD